jgi:hypothetical protein
MLAVLVLEQENAKAFIERRSAIREQGSGGRYKCRNIDDI